MVVILPDATASELEAVLRFVYGMVDTYPRDNFLAELLNMKKMPHRPDIFFLKHDSSIRLYFHLLTSSVVLDSSILRQSSNPVCGLSTG